MVDESQELRRVSWTELFSFTQIFKGFRMAIHPSKMILALAAIVLVCVLGWVMDRIWTSAGATSHVSDVYAYYQASNGKAYQDGLDRRREAALRDLARAYALAERRAWDGNPVQQAYENLGGSTDSSFFKEWQAILKDKRGDRPQPDIRKADEVWEDVQDDPKDVWSSYSIIISNMIDDFDEIFEEAEEAAEDKIGSMTRDDRKAAEKQLASDVAAAQKALWVVRVNLIDALHERAFGRGPWAVLCNYETECFGNLVASVRRGNFFTGFRRVLNDRGGAERASLDRVRSEATGFAVDRAIPFSAADNDDEGVGMLAWVGLMAWGLLWLVCDHLLFAIVFVLVGLAIWAILGGAIARIAALHAAREEKIPMGQALSFALGKFFSFYTAPLILVAIILVMGFLLGVGGLIMSLPVGDIIMGALFVAALVLGAVITFLALGLAAGFPLMYPTIAVEGSDSFDAISRSISYVFARPWRYGLYSLVAAVYGTACYIFIRVFALGTLLSAHFFVARGFFGTGLAAAKAPELGEGATKMDLLFVRPTFDQLAGRANWAALNGTETVAAVFVNLWVYLVVGLVAAFVLSFVVSSYTTIYYLLRRKEDATDLDDVYIEEPEETADLPEPSSPAPEPTPSPEQQAQQEPTPPGPGEGEAGPQQGDEPNQQE